MYYLFLKYNFKSLVFLIMLLFDKVKYVMLNFFNWLYFNFLIKSYIEYF